MVKQPLIERFVQTYNQLSQSLDSADLASANRHYQYLHQLYAHIDKSSMNPVNKELAYEKLTDAYKNLNNPSRQKAIPLSSIKSKGPYYHNLKQQRKPGQKRSFISNFKPKDFLMVTVIILIMAAVVFIKPEYIGLLSFDEHSSLEQSIDYTFDKNSDYIVTLKGIPTSLKLSGQLLNDKGAKVYAQYNNQKILIFDSENKLLIKNNLFSTMCIESCYIEGFGSREVRLIVELERGAKLFLEKLDYTVDAKLNNPPVWDLEKPNYFEVKQGSSIALDLTKYFIDKDGDELTFLSTGTQNLLINMGSTTLVITPKDSFVGEELITVIASDLKDVTRVPVKIVVKENQNNILIQGESDLTDEVEEKSLTGLLS